ncbi:MAG: hypothetical protein U9N42_02180 [Campylobacterota bacterium]|nr:hypothetical protein [Campylobacterota bacterium]
MRIYILTIIFATSLFALENTLRVTKKSHDDGQYLFLLKKIYNNTYMKFKYKNTPYTCRPYAVVTLDEMEKSLVFNEVCQDAFKKYYINNPYAKSYAKLHLHLEQLYHLEPKKRRDCIMYSQGTRSYAESLLYEGLAVIKPSFRDELWKFRLNRAQLSAKDKREGVWGTTLLRECIAGIYAE